LWIRYAHQALQVVETLPQLTERVMDRTEIRCQLQESGAAACSSLRCVRRIPDESPASGGAVVRPLRRLGQGGALRSRTKGKRRRKVPIIAEIRDEVQERLTVIGDKPMGRLFTGPISTAVLRNATHWDEVVAKLGYEQLRRHDLRHTELTWLADAGVPIHVLQQIAGHAEITTTQRYLHPSTRSVSLAGESLGARILASRSPSGPRADSADLGLIRPPNDEDPLTWSQPPGPGAFTLCAQQDSNLQPLDP
jgi:hypothetical protein